MTEQWHKFMGDGDTCALMLEMPGYLPSYCQLPPLHPVHSGLCFHCGFRLESSKGDGSEVCRFCYPHFSQAPGDRRCKPCKEKTWHF